MKDVTEKEFNKFLGNYDGTIMMVRVGEQFIYKDEDTKKIVAEAGPETYLIAE